MLPNKELQDYFSNYYPTYKINPNKGYNGEFGNDIFVGLLVLDGDFILDKALVYYFNSNYDISQIVVKPFPC